MVGVARGGDGREGCRDLEALVGELVVSKCIVGTAKLDGIRLRVAPAAVERVGVVADYIVEGVAADDGALRGRGGGLAMLGTRSSRMLNGSLVLVIWFLLRLLAAQFLLGELVPKVIIHSRKSIGM